MAKIINLFNFGKCVIFHKKVIILGIPYLLSINRPTPCVTPRTEYALTFLRSEILLNESKSGKSISPLNAVILHLEFFIIGRRFLYIIFVFLGILLALRLKGYFSTVSKLKANTRQSRRAPNNEAAYPPILTPIVIISSQPSCSEIYFIFSIVSDIEELNPGILSWYHSFLPLLINKILYGSSSADFQKSKRPSFYLYQKKRRAIY